MFPLRGILSVLTHASDATTREEDIDRARQEIEEALAVLSAARGQWSSAHALDVDAVRRALDLAERQLAEARVRLQRALARRD